jgi:hypothetical protein
MTPIGRVPVGVISPCCVVTSRRLTVSQVYRRKLRGLTMPEALTWIQALATAS